MKSLSKICKQLIIKILLTLKKKKNAADCCYTISIINLKNILLSNAFRRSVIEIDRKCIIAYHQGPGYSSAPPAPQPST